MQHQQTEPMRTRSPLYRLLLNNRLIAAQMPQLVAMVIAVHWLEYTDQAWHFDIQHIPSYLTDLVQFAFIQFSSAGNTTA